jgi:hypothetical protein
MLWAPLLLWLLCVGYGPSGSQAQPPAAPPLVNP